MERAAVIPLGRRSRVRHPNRCTATETGTDPPPKGRRSASNDLPASPSRVFRTMVPEYAGSRTGRPGAPDRESGLDALLPASGERRLFGLSPGGVCRVRALSDAHPPGPPHEQEAWEDPRRLRPGGGLLHHRFTLASPRQRIGVRHPIRCEGGRSLLCGTFRLRSSPRSRAEGDRSLPVRKHPALRSPDFPPPSDSDGSDRLAPVRSTSMEKSENRVSAG